MPVRIEPGLGLTILTNADRATPHPKLSGTIYTAAEEIEKAGGTALPLVVDIQQADQVEAAIEQAAETFGGGLDIIINNVRMAALLARGIH